MKTKLKCKYCGETMKFFDDNGGATNLFTLKCYHCGSEAWMHRKQKNPYEWKKGDWLKEENKDTSKVKGGAIT